MNTATNTAALPAATVRALFAAATDAVRAANNGQIPGRRTDVTVDGRLCMVYGVSAMRTCVAVQAVIDGHNYSADLGKSGRFGKVASWPVLA
jgi:hypothetical protein